MTTYSQLLGTDVYDERGQRIGKLDSFYTDEDEADSTPDMITVRTGFWGNHVSFVPLDHAKETEDGLQVNFTKDQVKDAPHVDADQEISNEEEDELYRYYGRLSGTDTGLAAGNGDSDTGNSDASDAMTRSEEEVRVDKQRIETGRIRLKKYIVTENVNFTVPVKKEKVRLVREPITDGDIDTTPELSENEQEIALHEEQVNIDKTVVPKERVRLDKQTIEEQREVNENVRKERVEVDDDLDDEDKNI